MRINGIFDKYRFDRDELSWLITTKFILFVSSLQEVSVMYKKKGYDSAVIDIMETGIDAYIGGLFLMLSNSFARSL